MTPAKPSADTRAGYPVEIVNDVLGFRKRIYTPFSRARLIENLLWNARRSIAAKRKREPFDCCVCIFADRIVIRFHCPVWKDPEAAVAAMSTIIERGSTAV